MIPQDGATSFTMRRYADTENDGVMGVFMQVKRRIKEEVESGAIRARLLAPVAKGNWEELRAHWFHTHVRWRLANLGQVVDDPGLPGRLRGAFGLSLMRSASPESLAGAPCPWDPPCAFEVLFRKQGRITSGIDFPSPWIIMVDRIDDDLIVTLQLFGFASEFAPAAIEAMSNALMHSTDFSGTFKNAPSTHVIDRMVGSGEAPDYSISTPRAIALDFMSPVNLTGKSVIDHPASLLAMLPFRLTGVARWMDFDLVLNRDCFLDAIQRLSFSWTDFSRLDWVRKSGPQKKKIPMKGYMGRLSISGDSHAIATVLPALSFGEIAFCGADVAFGLGRYNITLT